MQSPLAETAPECHNSIDLGQDASSRSSTLKDTELGEDNIGNQESGIDGCRDAANASLYVVGSTSSRKLMDPSALRKAYCQMLDAPEDLPESNDAFNGLAIAIRECGNAVPGALALAEGAVDAINDAKVAASVGATKLALNRRRGKHLLFHIAIELSKATKKGVTYDPKVVRIFGAWCLTRSIGDYQPSTSAIAKVRKAITNPISRRADGWSSKARERSWFSAYRRLNEMIVENVSAAARHGLCQLQPKPQRSTDQIDVFNREFRSRSNSLIEYATQRAVAGALGYETLSSAGVREAGLALISRVKTGDKLAVVVCLEIITSLTSAQVLQLPLVDRNDGSIRPLAWLDLISGTYCYVLYKLMERGAKPAAGSEHLYESAGQVVSLRLSPPLLDFLRAAEGRAQESVANLEGLLGSVTHHPRSAISGSGPYRVTARRLQESIPAILLGAGQPRWPVALATNTQCLVSRGRPSYGLCAKASVDDALNAAYEALSWPSPPPQPSEELIGSLTTPKSVSISVALNFLADEADLVDVEPAGYAKCVRILNRHTEWMAMVLALGLSLRRWNHYQLSAHELEIGESIHFDDKNVHELKNPPLPIARFVNKSYLAWVRMCHATVKELLETEDSLCAELALRITRGLNGDHILGPLFKIDAVGRLEEVGSHTWRQALPPNIQLNPNFARHFWPLQLTQRGIEQTAIDIFMRHQIEGLHLGSSNAVKTRRDTRNRLRSAIDSTIFALNLAVPIRLAGN